MAERPWDAPELPTGEAKSRAVREMFDAVAPKYDRVNRIMTLRLDGRWRRRAVRDLALPAGSLVIDLAAGTGDLCVDLRAAGHVAIAIDYSYGMLSAGRSGAPRVQADVLTLPLAAASTDGATCGFALRNFVDLGAFFDELGRVVRRGGRIALVDASTPKNPVMRWGHGIYFGKVVPRIGGLFGSDAGAYRYLPRSLAYLPPIPEMLARLEAAGFREVRRVQLTAGAAHLITATRA